MPWPTSPEQRQHGLGLPAADVTAVRRAGYVHDLGRMGVPNSVWEKPEPLTESDRERIRLYPYLTGRTLSRVHGLEVVSARSPRRTASGSTARATREDSAVQRCR